MVPGTIVLTEQAQNDEKVLTYVPFEKSPSQVNTSSSMVTPNYASNIPVEKKHQVVLLNHFVDYFKDEYQVEYIALRILLPTGIDYNRMPESMKHDVSTDGFSYSVEYLLPSILSDTDMVNQHWSSKPLSATYTAGMRNGVLMALNASILNYRTSLGHTQTSERLFAKFTIKLEKQCYVDVCHQFIREEGTNKGICLNVILKCKKATIQIVTKALSLSRDNEEHEFGSSFGMPPPMPSPNLLLPSPIHSFPANAMYPNDSYVNPSTLGTIHSMSVPPIILTSHVPSQCNQKVKNKHVPHPTTASVRHVHVPAIKVDKEYQNYLAYKLMCEKSYNKKLTPLEKAIARNNYRKSNVPRSSNQSVSTSNTKRSKYNPEMDPLVIQARMVLPGTNQLAMLQQNAMKAQAELEAHTRLTTNLVNTNNQGNLIGMQLQLQHEEYGEQEETETPTQILSPTQTHHPSASYHALHGQTEEQEIGNGNNSESCSSSEEDD